MEEADAADVLCGQSGGSVLGMDKQQSLREEADLSYKYTQRHSRFRRKNAASIDDINNM